MMRFTQLVNVFSLMISSAFLFQACQSDQNSKTTPSVTSSTSSSSQGLAPDRCNVYPFPEATVQKINSNPRYSEIDHAFKNQLKLALEYRSPYGEKFIEVLPDRAAGYAEGYFDLDNGPNLDGINRKFIHLKGYDHNFVDYFQPLYALGASFGGWNPNRIQRASGVVFGGYKISPEILIKNCGIWSNLFKSSPNNEKKRRFQEMIERDEKIPDYIFNLSAHLSATTDSIFLSTTRSVHVARNFALHVGHQGVKTSAGYVYVFLVHQGFDTYDQANQEVQRFYREQEITVSGSIPWGNVIGYRKILMTPNKGSNAPPELVGPIYLREDFEKMEPEIAKQVITQLSIKSRFTRAHVKGKAWKLKGDALDRDYWVKFFEKYPWDNDSGTH